MQVTTLSVRSPRTFAIIMETGEEVLAGLDRFARHIGIDAAAFTAVGGISEGTLGFFDPDIADYREIPVEQQSEVVSLLGDITRGADDSMDPQVHGHIVVAGADGQARGGHLLRAVVRPTLEVVVTETPAHLQRREDPETGLALIDLEASDTVGQSFSLPLDDPL
ncbi:MAG: PPC domain-containing DNA-binding protein [Candidatus Limnocylindrales bacterium]